MRRVASFLPVAAFLLGAGPLSAQQSYHGTWVVAGNQGPVTLVLDPPGTDGRLRGTISGSGISLRIDVERLADRVMGQALATDGSGVIYFEAMLEGAGLRVLFADVDAAGEPVASSAQQFVFSRQSGASAGPARGGMLGQGGAAPAGGGGARLAGGGPNDSRIAELLLSSAWCSFSFNGSTTRRERYAFSRDGTVSMTGGAETSRSVRGTDQYGNETFTGGSATQESQANRAYWRVENGMLMLSLDGQQWQPQRLDITPNSNGVPIVTANGTEYARCQ